MRLIRYVLLALLFPLAWLAGESAHRRLRRRTQRELVSRLRRRGL